MITATGLGSGLDISGLVDQLVAAERAGSDLQLSRQQSRYSAKFSALGSLKSSLSSFQSALGSINTLSNYSKNTATSSSTSTIGVTAGSDAVPNSYSISVDQLAESHSLASGTFVDADESAIGTGTLTIRFGTTDYVPGTDTYNGFTLNADKNAANIEIDSSNNTLEGVVREIKGNTCVVQLDDGGLIDAVPVNVSKVGERTRVSIRPERVEINKDRLQEGAHTLKAEVLEFVYMGDIFRTRLSVAGNDEFVIKTRNAPDQVRLEPGTQIEIGWLPDDCRALDASN
jgi:flagellar capping protein FliD